MNTDAALQRALEIASTKAELARLVGVTAQTVNQWFKRERDVPPPRAYLIEQKLGIDRRWFRPDDWERHWPDIIGTEIRALPAAPTHVSEPEAA